MRAVPFTVLAASITLLAGGLFGCHPAKPMTATAEPFVEPLVAEGPISAIGRPFVPVTIKGQSWLVIPDFGDPETNSDVDFLVYQVGMDLMASDKKWDFATDNTSNQIIDTLKIGKVVLTHIYTREMQVTKASPSKMPPVIGQMGIGVLSHFDVVFDGSARRVRLYTLPTSPPVRDSLRLGWLPPGFAASDCVPISADPSGVLLPLLVNGHPLQGKFDSGKIHINMNMAAARVLGITHWDTVARRMPSDELKHVPGAADSLMRAQGVPPAWLSFSDPDTSFVQVRIVTGATLQIGPHRLADDTIYVNGTSEAGDPAIDLGTDMLRDRILLVSYGAKRACLHEPR